MLTNAIHAFHRSWGRLRSRSHIHYLQLLTSALADCSTVLDLGCGSRPFLGQCRGIECIIGVDGSADACRTAAHAPKYGNIVEAVLPAIPFRRQSVDAVVLLQVLEHLPKADGYRILKEVEHIARHKVVLTTPNGFVSQEEYDGNAYQRHVSGWSVEDLTALGYQVLGLEGFRALRRRERAQLVFPAGLWHILVSLGVFESYV